MNVVWIVIDCLRADHVGCYGYGRPTTPNLDWMAREAVRLLIEQVRAKRSGGAQAVEHKLLNFTLVTRESTMSAPPLKRKGKQ